MARESKEEQQRREAKERQLQKDVEEAEKYGLSYGVYVAYKESGYLNEYIERLKASRRKRTEIGNVIESNLIGAGSKSKHSLLEGNKIS